MQAVLGIDIGTTGTKACVYDIEGSFLGRGYRDYPLDQPRVGWVEQNPDRWRDASYQAIRTAVTKSRVHPKDIVGVGVSGANAAVLVDSQGRPIGPAIMQLDCRAKRVACELRTSIDVNRVFAKTGNRCSAGLFSAPTLLWLKQNEADRYRRAQYILSPAGYVTQLLTGQASYDYSRASTTLLFDAIELKWSEELCELFGLDRLHLPPVHASTDIVGAVSYYAAQSTGLSPGTPVVAGAMDTAAATLSMGVREAGQIGIILGTVARLALCIDEPNFDPRFLNAANGPLPNWLTMAPISSAGLSVRWFRDMLEESNRCSASAGGPDEYSFLDGLAATSPPGAGGLLYAPFLQGEYSPEWDDAAKGVFFGVNAAHQRKDFIRAIYEGVGFAIRINFEIMNEQYSIAESPISASGGGARSKQWIQLLADILGRPLKVAAVQDTETFGIAAIAALGTGAVSDIDDFTALTLKSTCSIIEPARENFSLYNTTFERYRRMLTYLRPAFRECTVE